MKIKALWKKPPRCRVAVVCFWLQFLSRLVWVSIWFLHFSGTSV